MSRASRLLYISSQSRADAEGKQRLAKIYRDREWDEYLVRFYYDEVQQDAADYHTDDHDDAVDTAYDWVNGNGVLQEVDPFMCAAQTPIFPAFES